MNYVYPSLHVPSVAVFTWSVITWLEFLEYQTSVFPFLVRFFLLFFLAQGLHELCLPSHHVPSVAVFYVIHYHVTRIFGTPNQCVSFLSEFFFGCFFSSRLAWALSTLLITSLLLLCFTWSIITWLEVLATPNQFVSFLSETGISCCTKRKGFCLCRCRQIQPPVLLHCVLICIDLYNVRIFNWYHCAVIFWCWCHCRNKNIFL